MNTDKPVRTKLHDFLPSVGVNSSLPQGDTIPSPPPPSQISIVLDSTAADGLQRSDGMVNGEDTTLIGHKLKHPDRRRGMPFHTRSYSEAAKPVRSPREGPFAVESQKSRAGHRTCQKTLICHTNRAWLLYAKVPFLRETRQSMLIL